MSIKLEGLPEFDQAIKKLLEAVSPEKIEPVLYEGAKMHTTEAKAIAPVRRSQGGSRKKPPGVLKKGIKTKKLQRYYGKAAPSISAVDWKIAPHAYLVHEGTGERVGGSKSRRYKGKKFGRMPANPFFVNAWNSKRSAIEAYIAQEAKKLIEGAVK